MAAAAWLVREPLPEVDRPLHHAVVIQIEGSSYRLRQHADLVPEHIRSNALIHCGLCPLDTSDLVLLQMVVE
jgi:hypothetical protein